MELTSAVHTIFCIKNIASTHPSLQWCREGSLRLDLVEPMRNRAWWSGLRGMGAGSTLPALAAEWLFAILHLQHSPAVVVVNQMEAKPHPQKPRQDHKGTKLEE